ncbi:hypothetical protein ASPACDRAFT_1854033 [Aspergillus aculeatus ATCC 16872]|uniref:Roadblock/LAMTOR2 domain-containing protein n=1 Tax=Aspergillus aculeatus (strain ATCC 16872 / CBS 172.66 / WB 5094) TaxID=690307 RepID=A0A1L9X1K1_ASPA1|nr:uncharacterized protein ASPACDRAFT_1854033 [Aspergillus aculeatus ATCC 16872]OJK02018.1 hypothetical protein ASPACDRAFT_1854033 [Aspergillus aculeatus ATCC 16872]
MATTTSAVGLPSRYLLAPRYHKNDDEAHPGFLFQSPQIPHHVTALLSHLTSRPGVQSTFILSRKDGSIIQSTGLYAFSPTTRRPSRPTPSPTPAPISNPASSPSPATAPATATATLPNLNTVPVSGSGSSPTAPHPDQQQEGVQEQSTNPTTLDATETVPAVPATEEESAAEADQPDEPPTNTDKDTSPIANPDPTTPQTPQVTTLPIRTKESAAAAAAQQEHEQAQAQEQQQEKYTPSPAETLAAHIFAYVTSAAELSAVLADPTSDGAGGRQQLGYGVGGGVEAGNRSGEFRTGHGIGQGQGQGHEQGEGERDEEEEEGDEVKLLRLRTRKHEIVVVPDRKYLLCVVHGHGSGHGGGAGAGAKGAVGGGVRR